MNIPQLKGSAKEAGEHRHQMPSTWSLKHTEKQSVHTFIDCGGTDPSKALSESGGKHTHDVDVNAATVTSVASSGLNRPKWYALCYIMKT